MQYLAMPSEDIRRNLATEQYLMNSDKLKLPFMLFYIEKPCIIVGRNQNKGRYKDLYNPSVAEP